MSANPDAARRQRVALARRTGRKPSPADRDPRIAQGQRQIQATLKSAVHTPPDSHQDRHTVRDALLAALLLIYRGAYRDALDGLNRHTAPETVSPQAESKLAVFADDRSRTIQSGISSRMDSANDPNTDTTPAAAQRGMDRYNAKTLIPFLVGTAAVAGLIAAYRDSPAPNGQHRSAADSSLWVWTRNTDAPDDECAAAAGASPAPLADLIDIAGDYPPIHENCQCDLSPA